MALVSETRNRDSEQSTWKAAAVSLPVSSAEEQSMLMVPERSFLAAKDANNETNQGRAI